MGVVEDTDRLMQEAEVLFANKKSIMRSDYRVVAEDQMICAREFRQGIEKKSCVAKAKQAKLYSERAQMALDAVKQAIENAGG